MKRYFHAFLMTQSMFCAIPFPSKVWDEKARPLMLLFLPIVGLEIGLIWYLLGLLCRNFELPGMITGLILFAFPYLVTGFMHLDGFMDVTDAVRSWRDLEKRQQILKDSHVGAFSVIGLVFVLIAGFVLMSSIKQEVDLRILILVPTVSRCGSALAVTMLRPMTSSQYAGTFREDIPKSHPWILSVMLIAAVTAGFILCNRYGLVLLGGMIGYIVALRRGFGNLGGMNGDIAGYALVISELCSMAVMALL